MEEFMKIARVAELMSLSKQAIHVAVRTGRIKGKKMNNRWYVHHSEYLNYVNTRYSRALSKRPDGSLLYDPMKNEYSINQVAEMCGVSRQRVYYCVRMHFLPSERVGAAYVITVQNKDWVRNVVKAQIGLGLKE